MSVLDDLKRQAESLTPEEQRDLAAWLIQHAGTSVCVARPGRKWREIRGMARDLLEGEDAQAWVSRGRGK